MIWLLILATLLTIAATWSVIQWRRTYPEEHEFREFERQTNVY